MSESCWFNVTPYKCPLCQGRFRRYCELAFHQDRTHGVVRYKCPVDDCHAHGRTPLLLLRTHLDGHGTGMRDADGRKSPCKPFYWHRLTGQAFWEPIDPTHPDAYLTTDTRADNIPPSAAPPLNLERDEISPGDGKVPAYINDARSVPYYNCDPVNSPGLAAAHKPRRRPRRPGRHTGPPPQASVGATGGVDVEKSCSRGPSGSKPTKLEASGADTTFCKTHANDQPRRPDNYQPSGSGMSLESTSYAPRSHDKRTGQPQQQQQQQQQQPEPPSADTTLCKTVNANKPRPRRPDSCGSPEFPLVLQQEPRRRQQQQQQPDPSSSDTPRPRPQKPDRYQPNGCTEMSLVPASHVPRNRRPSNRDRQQQQLVTTNSAVSTAAFDNSARHPMHRWNTYNITVSPGINVVRLQSTTPGLKAVQLNLE